MKKYTIEMCYSTNISVDVEAEDKDGAVIIAKGIVSKEVNITDGQNTDAGELEFEAVTYID